MNFHLFDTCRIEKQGKFNEKDARICMKAVLSALEYIHRAVGIIHRDIKPQNLVFASGDHDYSQVKIIDFNLSLIVDPSCVEEGVTVETHAVGSAEGTKKYIAPGNIYEKI